MRFIIALVILRFVYKIAKFIYRWVFTSYGQMALIRWEQGDFTDYE